MVLSSTTRVVAILALLTSLLAPLPSTAKSYVVHRGGYCVPRRTITSTISVYPAPTRTVEHTVTTITTTLVTITATKRIEKHVKKPVHEYKIADALELPQDYDSQKLSPSTSTSSILSTSYLASALVDSSAPAASPTSSVLPLPSTSTQPVTRTTTPAPVVPEVPVIPKVPAAPVNRAASFESKAEVAGFKPCELSVYSYDSPEVCSNTYNTGGACGLSTYFPDTLGIQLPRLAVPNSIFDGFGASQHNTLCGKTVTIKAANGKIGKAIIADRNLGTSFDLCMDLWVEFGYDNGGGRFQAEYTFD